MFISELLTCPHVVFHNAAVTDQHWGMPSYTSGTGNPAQNTQVTQKCNFVK